MTFPPRLGEGGASENTSENANEQAHRHQRHCRGLSSSQTQNRQKSSSAIVAGSLLFAGSFTTTRHHAENHRGVAFGKTPSAGQFGSPRAGGADLGAALGSPAQVVFSCQHTRYRS